MRKPKPEPAFFKIQKRFEHEKLHQSRRAYVYSAVQKFRLSLTHAFFEHVTFLEWKVYKSFRRHVNYEDEVAEMSFNLLRDYVQFRLPNSLKPNINPKHKKKPKQHVCAIFNELQSIGSELDRQYLHLYKDIARQLNVNISSKRLVEEVFQDVAREMFRDKITWVRIISLYLFASSLAIECLLQGNGIYMQYIFNIFREFVRTDLATWIVQHGGWGDLVRTFHGHWLTDYPVLLMVVTSLCFILLYMAAVLFESAILSSRRLGT